MGQIEILNQATDTVKFHIYPDSTNENSINRYNKIIDELKEVKMSAQDIHHSNNDLRYVKTEIGGQSFNVMATTVKGFSVTIKNNDISFSFKKITSLNQNPIIKIEPTTLFLYRFGQEKVRDFVYDFVKTHLFPKIRMIVPEIHLCCDIQGYEFTQLDLYRFQKITRKNAVYESEENSPDSLFSSYFFGRDFTGFAFGGGDFHLRIYDKSKEISLKKNKDFIKHVWGNKYDPAKTVWRIEIQYRRNYLKHMYVPNFGVRGDDIDILNHTEYLWSHMLDNFKLKDINDANCVEHMTGFKVDNDGTRTLLTKEGIRTRLKRADLMPVWQAIQEFNGALATPLIKIKEVATASIQYVKNSLSALFSTMLKHYGKIDGEIITNAFVTANEHKKLDKGHGLIDDIYLKALDYLHSKEKLEANYGLKQYVSNDLKVTIKNHLLESLNILAYEPTHKNTIETYIKKIEKLGA